MNSNTTYRLLTALDVMVLLSISSTTLWRLIKRGEIEKPMYVGRTRYWKREELMSKLENHY